MYEQYDVIVIGAGLSGIFTALGLAEDRKKVLLLEAGNEILPKISSSHNECYKLHTGAHFLGDLKTAKTCLRRAISFAKQFPEFLAGSDLNAPWRRGRHYIMSNSVVSVPRAKEVFTELQNTYEELVDKDPANKVFGEPENFIRILKEADYSYIADKIPFYNANDEYVGDINVAMGVETGESQIDFVKMKEILQKRISENDNITFYGGHEAQKILRNSQSLGYEVSTKNSDGTSSMFKGATIVNCAWQNIEKLDQTSGLYVPDDKRVIRIKASIQVDLPESLRNINTCIFSTGPFASITVQEDCTAIITSERTTNVGFYNPNNSISQELQNKLDLMSLETTEGKTLAHKILEECASYLNEPYKTELMAAPIKQLRVGFVKLLDVCEQYSQDSIYNVNSSIHARNEDGVEVRSIGYFSNSGIKMTFTASNAKTLRALIAKDFTTLQSMENFIRDTKDKLFANYPHLKSKEIGIQTLLNINYFNHIASIVNLSEYKENPKYFTNECVQMILRDFHMERAYAFFAPKKTHPNEHKNAVRYSI